MSYWLDKIKELFNDNRAIAAFFAVVGLAVYSTNLNGPFLYDDISLVRNNDYIKSWSHLPQYFSQNEYAGMNEPSNYWRPLVLLVFSLEWHLWGEWPFGFHFVNIALHVASAFLLFLILLALFKKRGLAFLTALVFLIHPLQTEAVTYISGLGDPLSAFFMFLSILYFVGYRQSGERRHYAASLGSAILSLMVREAAVILPGFLLLVDFTLSEIFSFEDLKNFVKRAARALWPFFVAAAVYILLRSTVLNFQNTFNFYGYSNPYTQHILLRIMIFFEVLPVYFSMMIWPFNLHMNRSLEFSIDTYNGFVSAGGIALFVILLGVAVLCWRRAPAITFSVGWFFTGLAITSGIFIPVNAVIYEHWLYLPLAGFYLALFWLVIQVQEHWSWPISEKFLLACAVIYFAFLSTTTLKQNKLWSDPVGFYNYLLRYSPNDYATMDLLGVAYADLDQLDKAEEMFKRSIAIAPHSALDYSQLGIVYWREGKNELAEEYFWKSVGQDPTFLYAYQNLTSFYIKQGRYGDAVKPLEMYVEKGDDPKARVHAFLVLAKLALYNSDVPAAKKYAEQAVGIDQNNAQARDFLKMIVAIPAGWHNDAATGAPVLDANSAPSANPYGASSFGQ